MKNISVLVLVASIAFMAGVGVTYVSTQVTWISDMANQPSIKPQERPFPPPSKSIPTDLMGDSPASDLRPPSTPGRGEETGHAHGSSQTYGHHEHSSTGQRPEVKNVPQGKNTHAHQHSGPQEAKHHHDSSTGRREDETLSQVRQHAHEHAEPLDAHTQGASAPMHQHGEQKSTQASDGHMHDHGSGPQSGKTLVNPIKATEASVKKGEQLFNIYCQVCHGPKGQGGMPMATKIPTIPKFTAAILRGVSDDHMFSMVTAGHGSMPGYAEALTPEERWHVSNYVRSLQTSLANKKKLPPVQGDSQ